MISNIAFPQAIRPHLTVLPLLLEVTVEVVGEQLSRSHHAVVLGVVRGKVLALVEVLVEVRVLEDNLVELQLPCGDSGTRLSIDRPDENSDAKDGG